MGYPNIVNQPFVEYVGDPPFRETPAPTQRANQKYGKGWWPKRMGKDSKNDSKHDWICGDFHVPLVLGLPYSWENPFEYLNDSPQFPESHEHIGVFHFWAVKRTICQTHVVDGQTLSPHARSQTWFTLYTTCESDHFGEKKMWWWWLRMKNVETLKCHEVHTISSICFVGLLGE